MSGNTWRHNLPCKAHKLLAEMFENGKITDKTSPKVAQSFHSEFSKFTLAVFSNNFRQLRQLHLAECNIFETFNLPLFQIVLTFLWHFQWNSHPQQNFKTKQLALLVPALLVPDTHFQCFKASTLWWSGCLQLWSWRTWWRNYPQKSAGHNDCL